MVTRRRRGWLLLSAGQRRRYERAGITAEAYARGVSLSAARGHRGTPEHPRRASRDPDRYRGYLVGKGLGTLGVVTRDGVLDLTRLSKRERSLVARHWNAIEAYLDGRDDGRGLHPFEGVIVGGHELETRLKALDALALTHQLTFESIYEQVTG